MKKLLIPFVAQLQQYLDKNYFGGGTIPKVNFQVAGLLVRVVLKLNGKEIYYCLVNLKDGFVYRSLLTNETCGNLATGDYTNYFDVYGLKPK